MIQKESVYTPRADAIIHIQRPATIDKATIVTKRNPVKTNSRLRIA